MGFFSRTPGFSVQQMSIALLDVTLVEEYQELIRHWNWDIDLFTHILGSLSIILDDNVSGVDDRFQIHLHSGVRSEPRDNALLAFSLESHACIWETVEHVLSTGFCGRNRAMIRRAVARMLAISTLPADELNLRTHDALRNLLHHLPRIQRTAKKNNHGDPLELTERCIRTAEFLKQSPELSGIPDAIECIIEGTMLHIQRQQEIDSAARQEHIRLESLHASTRRNAPCHCGSGKKYKHCCLEATMAKLYE
jgi:hypothetical protein